jgi:hypothetical protein
MNCGYFWKRIQTGNISMPEKAAAIFKSTIVKVMAASIL